MEDCHSSFTPLDYYIRIFSNVSASYLANKWDNEKSYSETVLTCLLITVVCAASLVGSKGETACSENDGSHCYSRLFFGLHKSVLLIKI